MSDQLGYNLCPFTVYSRSFNVTGNNSFSVDIRDVDDDNLDVKYLSGSLDVTTSYYMNSTSNNFQTSVYMVNYIYHVRYGYMEMSGEKAFNFTVSKNNSTITFVISGIHPTLSTCTCTITQRTLYFKSLSIYQSVSTQNFRNGFTVFSIKAPYVNGEVGYIQTKNNSSGFVYGISVCYGGQYDFNINTTTFLNDDLKYIIFFTKFHNVNGRVTLSDTMDMNGSIGAYYNNITVGARNGGEPQQVFHICMCASGPP